MSSLESFSDEDSVSTTSSISRTIISMTSTISQPSHHVHSSASTRASEEI
jgi:hypothetical protein